MNACHLSHLAMQRNGVQAQVAEHERCSLRRGARRTEDHERVARQLVHNRHQINILSTERRQTSANVSLTHMYKLHILSYLL